LAVKGFRVCGPPAHRQSPHPDESRDGCFTIAEGKTAPNQSQHVQVRIEDANAHCARARKNGATILSDPKDQPYGERQYNAQDFFGHRWDFTETISDVAPEDWSGGEFHLE
jgi:uncharacterized glyoxalase superfamily protein PhnB